MRGLGVIVSGSTSWWPPCNVVPFIATDINIHAQVVGYTEPAMTFQYGFSWTKAGGMILFGSNWPPNYANGVNNNGRIVGRNVLHDCGDPGHAKWWKIDADWEPGVDLGTLGPVSSDLDYGSVAKGINDLGQIVGWSTTSPVAAFPEELTSPMNAVLWTPGKTIQDLGTLPGDISSVASKINLFGQVIGSSGNAVIGGNGCPSSPPEPLESSGRPFIWTERTGMHDLNTLIPRNSGWVLNTAAEINVWGQIVGLGTRNGQPHGYLLTPLNPFQVF